MSNRKSVVFVLTSHDDLDGKGTPTGTWLEELAASYYPFEEAGWDITIASPKGGKAPIDPASLEEPWLTETGKRFQDDATAMGLVNKSRTLDDVAAQDFDALYMVGGAGTAWDFPDNPALGGLLAKTAMGGVVGGVCHGVCGLLNPIDGKPLAEGRALTCISDKEEELTGFDKLVPLLPETTLREAGATVTVAGPLEPHVVEDGNIVTGQNPASAGGVAEAMLGLSG
jgi:putative intracellular protease/amidase